MLDIKPYDVQNIADQLKDLTQQDMDTLRRIRILILGLGDEWMGDAEKAYLNLYLTNEHYVTDLNVTLNNYIEIIQMAVDDSKRIDQSLLTQINKI